MPVPAQLPTLGDSGDLTSGSERKLGEQVAREMFRDPDYIDDPVLVEYVQSIWQPLLAAARARGEISPEIDDRFAWQVLLGRDRVINAFAVPGGWLGLQLGLISVTTSRAELASVLAHELSHVTQRHISRLMEQEKRQTPLLIAAMILGAMAASKNPDAGSAVITGGQALAIQNQLGFSRDMEREADRIGFGVMTQAGFEPQGFVSMFEKLQQASRLNDNGSFPYLRTHPLTSERIADMQSRVPLRARSAAGASAASAPVADSTSTASTAAPSSASTPATGTGSRPATGAERAATVAAIGLNATAATAPASGDPAHALMAARARVLANSNVDALRAQVGEADTPAATTPGPRQLPVLYASALAAGKLREHATAERLLARLTQAVANDGGGVGATAATAANELSAASVGNGTTGAPKSGRPGGVAGAKKQVDRLAAELALAKGDFARAAQLTDMSATARPDLLLAAEARTRTGKAGEASQRLATWTTVNPKDATAWQALGSAYNAEGQSLRAIRAEAEAQVAQLDYRAALDRLRAAQDLMKQGTRGRDQDIDASIIDTRARQVAALLREQTSKK